MAENLKVLGPERCRSLASKEMFCEVEGAEPAHAGGSGLFWCSQTLSCLGPDGQSVHHEDCKPGRSCYEAF